MNAPFPMPDTPRPQGEATAQRLGELGVSAVYERLCLAGKLSEQSDHALGRALVALAVQAQPSLLVLRFFDALPSNQMALSEMEICNTMARLGFEAAELCLTPLALDPRLGPMLAPEGGAQVFSPTTLPDGSAAMRIYDAETQTTRTLPADDPELAKPQRLLVFPPQGEGGSIARAGRGRREGQSWFMTLMLRMRATVMSLMVLGFALTVTAMSVPIFIMLIYDQVVGQRSPDPFLSIAAGAGVVVLAEVQLRFLRARTLAWLTARLDYLVGTALFEKLLTLPPRVAEQVPISSHIARIRTFESVRDFFSGPVLVSALGVPATGLTLLVIWLLAGPLVLVSLTTILIYLIAAAYLWRAVAHAIEDAALQGSASQRFALETFQKLDGIRRDGLATKWLEKHRDLSGAAMAAQYRLHMLGQICEVSGRVISGLAIIVTLWAGTQLVWAESLSVGALIAVTMLTWNTIHPFHSLISLLPRFEQSRKSIMQINAFMDADLDEDQSEGDVPAPTLKGEVEFANVAVRYSTSAGPIFAGLSFKANRGELIAVTGPNGAGKSSTLKLASGLQAPMLGAVRLDGLDARQLNPRDLRRRIAYVPQKVALFRGTIADNLRHANRMADDIELLAALDLVGGRALVDALPEGLGTQVNPAELRQADLLVQYIALARAVLQNSQLILIDERPASALRAGLDQDLKALLGRLHHQRTVILVAHRADFLRMADKAIALRLGQTPVIGSPDKIMDLLE